MGKRCIIFVFVIFILFPFLSFSEKQFTTFKVTNWSPAIIYLDEISSIKVQFQGIGDSYTRFYCAWLRLENGQYINLYGHNCDYLNWAINHCCGEVFSGKGEVIYNLDNYVKTPFNGQFIFAISSFVGYWDVNIIPFRKSEQTSDKTNKQVSDTSSESYKNVFQGVSSESLQSQLLFEKMKLLKQDLENHDVRRVFFYFDSKHMQTNIFNFMNNKFQFIEDTLNWIIWNWGFMEDNYKNRISNINDIESVLEFKIYKERVVFSIKTKDGNVHTIYSYINWENLTLVGASG